MRARSTIFSRLAAVLAALLIIRAEPAAAEGGDTPLAGLRPFPDQGVYVKDGKSYQCGLYPGGSNQMPAGHRQAGEAIAATIAPDASGKIVMLAAGHSNPREYFGAYIPFLKQEAQQGRVDPRVELVSICTGGKMCSDWAREFRGDRAPKSARAGSSAQVLLLLTSYLNASLQKSKTVTPEYVEMNLEERSKVMRDDLIVILQGFAKACPDLKIAYLGCDTWRGHRQLEPMVWEEAFAFKLLIEEQINGTNPELAYQGPNRKVPWLAWGGYIWENDPPRERFIADGVHPTELGKAFAVERWHTALINDSTAAPWLLRRR